MKLLGICLVLKENEVKTDINNEVNTRLEIIKKMKKALDEMEMEMEMEMEEVYMDIITNSYPL